MAEKLIEFIDKVNDTGTTPESENFIVKEIVSDSGFMVFSKKEQYTSKEINKFNSKYLFDKYPYKHRFFARYNLSSNAKTVVFLLYNPSYANPEKNDDTIKNCKKLAGDSGYGIVEIINLFSLRTPNPSKSALKNTNSVNKEFIISYLMQISNDENKDVVLAWGLGKEKDSYCKNLIEEIETVLKNKQTFIIGVNKEVVNEFNHHPSSQVWNGLGGFENLATLVKR